MMEIQSLISRFNDKLKIDILAKSRKRRIVYARFVAFKILKDKGFLLREMSEVFKLDHATITIGINKFDELKRYPDFIEIISDIGYDFIDGKLIDTLV
jgi:chromosomal replication initiation ATPase DnaA